MEIGDTVTIPRSPYGGGVVIGVNPATQMLCVQTSSGPVHASFAQARLLKKKRSHA